MAILRLDKGLPVSELVKGSLNYTLYTIQQAFYRQFSNRQSEAFWVSEIFADYVIVEYPSELNVDEFYRVGYEMVDGKYVFETEWVIVSLNYAVNVTAKVGERREGVPIRLLSEHQKGVVRLEAQQEGATKRTVTARLAQGDVINGNNRRYSSAVLREAVAKANGGGRLLGEAEHPADKRQRARFLETIVVWQEIWFDEITKWLMGRGQIIQNSLGLDAIATMSAGVLPGVSLRGYGESQIVREGEREFEEILWIEFTGFDLVLEPGFASAGVENLESLQIKETKMANDVKDDGVNGLDLETLRNTRPDLVAALRKDETAPYRQALGIGDDGDIDKVLAERLARLEALERQQAQVRVQTYLNGAVQDLPYPASMRESLLAFVGQSADEEAAKAKLAEGRKVFDPLAAEMRLRSIGFKGSVDDVRPVIEAELGIPEYARGAFAITETMVKAGLFTPRERKSQTNRNALFAKAYLERYDKIYRQYLIRESREWSEAMLTTQLNLPYSVMRAIIDEAFPFLVAASIFDIGVVEGNPVRVFYEANFTAESGYSGSVTDEVVTADHGTWVAMNQKRLTFGSVVVTNSAASVTYTEGTDYVVDYADGKLMALAAGAITDGQSLKVDYTYSAMRKGENAAIERARSGVSYADMSLYADRLATEISNETIKFSQAQLGFDAVTRTLNLLAKDVMRKIDSGLLYAGLAAALQVASNSGGTWTSATDPVAELIEKIGLAKVKVGNRNYDPTFVIMSLTNSDRLSNSDLFTAAGSRPDATLDVAGYVGMVKGIPVFNSTNFTDNYILVGNREVVMYRTAGDMLIKGPYPSYSSNQLLPNEQYYVEEYNGHISPIPGKASSVKVA